MDKATYLSVRIPTELNARMVELRPYLEKNPAFAHHGKLSRVALFHLTLQRGLETLEQELNVPTDMLIEEIEIDSDDEWGEATQTARPTMESSFSNDGWGFTVSDDGVVDATMRPASVEEGRIQVLERLDALIVHLEAAQETAAKVTKSIGGIIDLGGELSDPERELGAQLVELGKSVKRELKDLRDVRINLETQFRGDAPAKP